MPVQLLPLPEDVDVAALLTQVEQLVQEVAQLREENQRLRDEIARLKGEKGKPAIKPSKLDKLTDEASVGGPSKDASGKRPGSDKRSKTAELSIHTEEVIQPDEPLPAGARFKGYRDFVVQDLHIAAHNTRYRLAIWQLPDGQTVTGRLPQALGNRHFGSTLRSYVLYQHHHCHVTQPLLREQLREWGVDISIGQIDAILSQDSERFTAEKDALLRTGLAISSAITVDDTGARHEGKNGYVTHIGNDLFAWFGSSHSKSRINFLELLHAGTPGYYVNADALAYMHAQSLPQSLRQQLQAVAGTEVMTLPHWQHCLQTLSVDGERHQRIATEGALLGSLLAQGFNPELAIVSDGAGQFAVLRHALCWVHAERLVHKLIPCNDHHAAAIEKVRNDIWTLYADLKVYCQQPQTEAAKPYADRFDAIFTQWTSFETLNRLLRRLHGHKDELLRVLEQPDIPLHTNGSETDIRDYVKKRKVSGGTRSELGRTCRDTFASLKKTCRKLGISFWAYLLDRLQGNPLIPELSELMRQRAAAL